MVSVSGVSGVSGVSVFDLAAFERVVAFFLSHSLYHARNSNMSFRNLGPFWQPRFLTSSISYALIVISNAFKVFIRIKSV